MGFSVFIHINWVFYSINTVLSWLISHSYSIIYRENMIDVGFGFDLFIDITHSRPISMLGCLNASTDWLRGGFNPTHHIVR